MDHRRRREAENELPLRSVNDEIEHRAGDLDSEAAEEAEWEFLCECANASCSQLLSLTVKPYEAVRAEGKRFIVAPSPGHVDVVD